MSNAKLAAAKELIQEKNYAVARQLLTTMDDPLAVEWLMRIDRIAPAARYVAAPPPVSAEQEKFYRSENKARRRRRRVNGFELIMGGSAALFFFAIMNFPSPVGQPRTISLFEIALLVVAAVCIIGGFIKMIKRD